MSGIFTPRARRTPWPTATSTTSSRLNDTFGHAAGDRALRTFAQVLRDSLRPADISGRYGGEEFVIILPECPVDEARQVLERVRERLAERIVVADLPPFTVSFGLASSDPADDFDQVVALADALCSRQGRGSESGRDLAGPGRRAAEGPVGVRVVTRNRGNGDALGNSGREPQHS